MSKELIVTAPYQLAYAGYEEDPLAADQVRAVAQQSAISHGTEMSLYRGTGPFHQKRFDTERRLFVTREGGSAYPQAMGYEWVGRVRELGVGVSGYRVGDMVHLPSPHRQTQTFTPEALRPLGVAGPLPAALNPQCALFLTVTAIALQAIHDARIKPGDRVVVFGLGVLGLLAVQLARLSGARWIDAVDPIGRRRELGVAFGATRTFDPLQEDVGAELKQDGPGADVAIEFSGAYAALHQAIRCVRMGGHVVAAGFYQGGATGLNLGEEWLHNRVSMVASLQGWGNPHREYPAWDRARLRATALALLEKDQVTPERCPTISVPFDRAHEAYELIDKGDGNVLKVVLTY